jgi:murein tripeptide amidase MpaA
VITITSNPHGRKVKNQKPLFKRQAIIITARVHPGESVASLVFAGLLTFLLSKDAILLRDQYIFKLVPCLNPDGVVIGNYRSSLAGVDLNR